MLHMVFKSSQWSLCFRCGWDKQDAAEECLFLNETDVSRKSIKLGGQACWEAALQYKQHKAVSLFVIWRFTVMHFWA